jgi:S-disulfanyl-L-cysteine oxidoreductase SoxD
MKGYSRGLMAVSLLMLSYSAFSQTPGQGIGRTLSEEEVNTLMYTVGPKGKELPQGQGTARQGAEIYAQSCIFCHGPGGLNGPQNALKGNPRLPFATSLWDFIHRAMPRSLANVGVQERQLTNDEVYALTAYILNLNGIIGEYEVMNAVSLPKVEIPIEKKH